MESKEKSKEYFDSIAEGYDASRDGKFVNKMYESIMQQVAGLSSGPEYILDLGCGTGNVISLLAEQTKAKLYGIDLSEQMVKEAEKHLGEKAEFVVGDVENLPYKEGQFDLIICNASFHHYTKPLKALQEIRRVLKPGGILILGDPTVSVDISRKITNWFLKYMNSGDYHIYGEKEITQLLAEQGLAVKHFEMVNSRSFLLTAQ